MHKILSLVVLFVLVVSCTNEVKITPEVKAEILLELQQINEIDQKYAGIPPAELFEKYGSKKAWELFEASRDSVGLLNQEKIKLMFDKYGYLGEKKIGAEAASDFWISIQHADNDVEFQERMLKAMLIEIESGSNDWYHYAMLEDRVNVNRNQAQRFGSQLVYNDLGQAIPKIGLVDSSAVDSLRKTYKLPSLLKYYNEMTEAHFVMNVSYLEEKGITEPQFYTSGPGGN